MGMSPSPRGRRDGLEVKSLHWKMERRPWEGESAEQGCSLPTLHTHRL